MLRNLYRLCMALLPIVLVSLTLHSTSWADEHVIYSFDGGTDGGYPEGGLIFDNSGNLYGTTAGDGFSSFGSVFKLSPTTSGNWQITVLHTFAGATDGGVPHCNVLLDAAGNLYGTTYQGGNLNFCNGLGCGTVFELSPGSGGHWKEAVLYSFRDSNDGAYPYAGLAMDAVGNLYGTTLKGGAGSPQCAPLGCGVVFQLAPSSAGWKETVLHAFHLGTDGAYPYGGVTLDSTGSVYGTANEAGGGAGTVFRLTPSPTGWSFHVIHSFRPFTKDGQGPSGTLVLDSAGNLYGTTMEGGSEGGGVVFELIAGSTPPWEESILHSLGGNVGEFPLAGVVFDSAGNLYGTTSYGGTIEGAVFELTPTSSGQWQPLVLYSFHGGKDGGESQAGVILDQSGNLYGTVRAGGSTGWGAVFEIIR